MQDTNNEPVMDADDAHNFASKMVRARIFAAVHDEFKRCEQLTHRILTPELFAQVFEELGVSAAERGEPITKCPWPSGAAATSYGLLCRHDWLKGWRAASAGKRRSRKVAR